MQVILTVTEGPHQGREFKFDGHDTFIVGRAKCAHFRLPEKDKYFSRVHFMVEVNPPQCRIMDLGSRNGTIVNGQKVVTADLNDGDVIRGGKTVIAVAIVVREPAQSGEPAVVPNLSDLPTIDPRPPPALPSTVSYGAHQDDCDVRVLTPGGVPPAVRSDCVVCGKPMSVERGTADPAGIVGRNAVDRRVCAACRAEMANRPQRIAGYRTVRELGRGGMGVVCLALRESDGELVAIKTIHPKVVVATRRDIEKFLREARILAELDHPHIVAFHEMGEAGEQLFFVMDYVRGRDVAAIMHEQRRTFEVGRAVRLICQVLQALDYAHAKRFVHRDIKPSNVLISGDHGSELAKLADFGLARTYQTSRISGLTMMGHFGGTVEYMAPEQLTSFRETKPASDIYSIGATLYTMLTGGFVYDYSGQIHRKIQMLLQEDPLPIRSRRPELPSGLAEMIDRSLARDPRARFPDAMTMRKALMKFSP